MSSKDRDQARTQALLQSAGIDPELSTWVLNKVREMDAGGVGKKAVEVDGFPVPQPGELREPQAGVSLIADISDRNGVSLSIDAGLAGERLRDAGIPQPVFDEILRQTRMPTSGIWSVSAAELETIGIAALPLVSYGILNGGSATSYADEKKNRSLNAGLFELYSDDFSRQAAACRGRAKGLTPGYINPDGSPGYSYIELKLRNAMLLTREHYRRFPVSQSIHDSGESGWSKPLFPLFQMSSSGNDSELALAYNQYRDSGALRGLSRELGLVEPWFLTGVQPLIAALTHSSLLDTNASLRRFFLEAWGKRDSPLALPGGHGQNFFALESVYRELHGSGKKLVYLGNVDNLGYLPDPLEIAVMLLTGSPAGFDFSFKTAVDIKGGVLIRQKDGRLNCADIGPAISPAEVASAEQKNLPILFNCATGLFNLDYLIKELPSIQQNLPLRVSDQDKDAGRYSQAEQVTWEVMGLIKGFTAFGVNKYQRFLAGKLLLENFMTSGLKTEDENFPEELRDSASKLHQGFLRLMREAYRLKLQGAFWTTASSEV